MGVVVLLRHEFTEPLKDSFSDEEEEEGEREIDRKSERIPLDVGRNALVYNTSETLEV